MRTKKSKFSVLEPIQSILVQNIEELGLQEHTLEQKIKSLWKEVVGERIAEVAKPFTFEKGRLTIRVKSKLWLRELQYFAERYRHRLNKKMNNNPILSVYFELGALPKEEWFEDKNHDPTPDWLHIAISEEKTKEIEEKLKHLPEGPLKETAKKIMLQHEKLKVQRRRTLRPKR